MALPRASQTPGASPPWPERVLLALGVAAVLAGLAGRAWLLGMAGLSSDEAFSWRLTQYPVAEMLQRAALDVHPPLYYLALDAWTRTVGDGPAALRGLSLLSGVAAIALAFALVRETERSDEAPAASPLQAPLLAAAMMAVHATQVLQSRNARMYALGTTMALASAWALLRAQRTTDRRLAWWMAWGLGAAAAVATHYYLLFTIAGQALWALGSRGPRRARPLDLAAAAAVGLAACAPWAAVFWRQARQVRADYWIPSLSATDLLAGVARWATGSEGGAFAPLVAVLVAASLGAAAFGGGRSGRFFALQAAAPWVLGLIVSAAAGRPIVLDRYMLFAQAFLVCAWAVAIASIRSPGMRLAAASLAVSVLGIGLASSVRTIPESPPAMANAARFLKRQAGSGDLVVVESPRALNKLRYYARQEGGDGLDIRSAWPERAPLGPHVSHVVSLTPDDTIPADAVFDAGADTVWRGRESTAPADPAPPGWTITYARIFEGGDDTRFALVRYRRATAPS